ncbi:MAG: heme-binding domain-containing protein [Acidobacteria bacterium]|nr:heme-binding domain-containing protein [Acidobacteriota bacterium]
MKKILKTVVLIVFAVLVLGFIVIQFFRPDFTNPPIDPAATLTANVEVPENVKTILDRSCRDCHTNETQYPWYAKIQPSAWFLKDHIDKGRREVNFSTWSALTPARRKRKLSEVCEQVQNREMPLPSYLWIHRDAALSDADIKTLCDWTEAARAKMSE